MTDKRHIVLIVEDDEVHREDVHRLIGDAFTVIDAATGREALGRVGSQEVHCVLLDYQLPDFDGLQVLPKLVEAQIPVVMMTAQGNERTAVRALKQGACDYLVKNALTDVSLKGAIEKAINHALLERKVREQQQDLEMFASIASHDLRAPLRTIKALVSFIKEDTIASRTDKVLDYCQRSINAANRMNQLIDRLLEYARVGRNHQSFEKVGLKEVTTEVVSSLESMIKDLAAEVEIGDLPEVFGDPIALGQLIQNLVANGLKFQSGHTPPRVRIAAKQLTDGWEISVEDNGIGIDPQYIETIFEPFKRLHRHSEYEGSGLGLATCKKIVGQHRGQIRVESQPGTGATFLFTLPTHATSHEDSSPHSADAA